MSITVVVMTDGRRDCITASIASMGTLAGDITARVIHDDSGDDGYRAWLGETFDGWQIISTGARSGFSGAYRNARRWVADHDTASHVFFTEDDFTYPRPVNLDQVAGVLTRHPHLVQMALRRQPWNAQEKAAGGIVEMHPGDYDEWSDMDGSAWLEHRHNITTNPALWPRFYVTNHPWPEGRNSEGRFGYDLFAQHPGLKAAYWGARDSGEWCQHIGVQRVGTGY
jgi:hypothetical protein